jgi:hypothetical protein
MVGTVFRGFYSPLDAARRDYTGETKENAMARRGKMSKAKVLLRLIRSTQMEFCSPILSVIV